MRKLYDEDDELRREFKDTFHGIHASEELKAHTLSQMMEETRSRSEGGKKVSTAVKGKWRIVVPAMALLCAAFVFVVFRGTPGTPYLTQMEEDVFYEEVMLEDGELHFVANRVAISITPNAGITVGQKQDGESPAMEDAHILEEKEMADGGQLVYKRIAAIKLPDIGEKDWSYIGEQKIYITMLDTLDTHYQAVFEKDGQAYEVTGIGVCQKEFIDYLYQIIKK